MRVFIDADGNAVTKIVESICKEYGVPVTAVKNYNINLQSKYMDIVTVDNFKESADLYIANHMTGDDVLITNDYGLASMVIHKSKKIFTQSGSVIDSDNIDFLLNTRHIHKEMRLKHNVYTKAHKRKPADDEYFYDVFNSFIRGEVMR